MSNSLKNRVNKGVLDLKPYEPGKPIEETEKELEFVRQMYGIQSQPEAV
mgnify:CR=1 FL=1